MSQQGNLAWNILMVISSSAIHHRHMGRAFFIYLQREERGIRDKRAKLDHEEYEANSRKNGF